MKYWNDEGKYQKEYNKLYKKLVPDSGRAKTMDGELLRCISRFYYDRYNNGRNANDMNYFEAFINFNYRDDLGIKKLTQRTSDKDLDVIVDKIVEHIKKGA